MLDKTYRDFSDIQNVIADDTHRADADTSIISSYAHEEAAEWLERRDECVKHFSFGGGKHQAVVYPEPVHYRDADGVWQEIDNNLELEGGRLVNRANSLRVELPQRLHKDAAVTVSLDGKTLSWRFLNSTGEADALVSNGAALESRCVAQLAKALPEAAGKSYKDVFTPQERRFDYTGKTAEAVYEAVAPGVSVKYTLHGQTVKEDIFLAEAAALPHAALLLGDGWRYRLHEDRTITAEDMASGEPIFVFAAPTATDAKGEPLCVVPKLDEEAGRTVLRYAIAEAELKNAAYPIAIDPIVYPSGQREAMETVMLTQNNAGYNSTSETMNIGTIGSTEKCVLFRVKKLARLRTSDTITAAILQIRGQSGDTAKYTVAHEVLQNWSLSSGLNYAWLNLGGTNVVSPDALDYVNFKAENVSYFDITNLYRTWYERDGSVDRNYGLLLRKATNVSGGQYQSIYTSNASTTSYKPRTAIYYTSHAGVEGWRTYESLSVGRAGTASVDLFNGNLVYTHADTAMTGSRMPVSLTHTYNSCVSDIDGYHCGYGWKHSGLQRVYDKSVNSKSYFIWVDGTGSEHWFNHTDGVTDLKDEEGQQYKLTRIAMTDNAPARIVITDKENNELQFRARPSKTYDRTWASFWLYNVKDAQGNTASYTYQIPANYTEQNAMDAVEGRLTKITDGAGRETTFTYHTTGMKRLAKITIPAASGTRSLQFAYSEDRLASIQYYDLTSTQKTSFGYPGGSYLLTQVKNYDNQQIDIVYEDASKYSSSQIENSGTEPMRRVVSMTKSGSSGTVAGTKELFDYRVMRTAVTYVKSDSAPASANKSLIYQFDTNGNVVGVRDELGYARFTKYSSSIPNAATAESKLQKAVVNRLYQVGFGDQWTATGVDAGNTVTVETATGMNGSPAAKMVKSAATATVYRHANLTLEKGKNWSFTAYVKLEATGEAYIRLTNTAGGVLAESPHQTAKTTVGGDSAAPTDNWVRLHALYSTQSATGNTQVRPELVSVAAGTVFFSCPQVEEGLVANSVNLLRNGDFREGLNGKPTGWTANSDYASDAAAIVVAPATVNGDPFPTALNGNMLRCPGYPDKSGTSFYQEVSVRGAKGDVFMVGGWANGKSMPETNASNRGLRVTIRFYVSGAWTDPEDGYNPFNVEWVGWQYMCAIKIAPEAYTKVRVAVAYIRNDNTAYFTNVFLHKESFGRTFVYDNKKNVTSTTNRANEKSGREYDDADNVTSYYRPGRSASSAYTMTYGDTSAQRKKHLLMTSTTPEGVKESFTYDGYGNQLTATAQTSTSTPRIKSETEYTGDGNYVLRSYDARGKKVEQVTNAGTGTVTSRSDPQNTTVNYTYDSADRVNAVQATTNGKTYRNAYTYENDRIKTVSHNTTSDSTTDVTYTFTYDALGNQTAVKVGQQQQLSRNVYSSDRSQNLMQVEYGATGSNKGVRYAYDAFDRVIGVSYDGADPATSPRYKYEYGANGQVSYVTDTALKRTQWTEYDLAQRPMQTYTFANANGLPQTRLYSTRLRYDKFNNLITFRENVSGTAHDTEYVYDKDDRTKKIAFRTSAKLRGIEYTYDTVNRIASVSRGTATVSSAREVTVTPNAALGTTFTFALGDTTRYGAQASTPLVASMASGTGANAMSFSYAYDNVGNISSETRNGAVTSYTYDNLGQLTRVNDPHQNMTWTYAYDRGGNILNKKRYAYTTGTLGTVLETINYTYGDSNWKDRLTKYSITANGQTIDKIVDYESIGNPRAYDGWTYTWQAGRQLASLVRTGTNASFQYDANGLRIQKTVNSDVTDYTLHGKLVMHLKRGSDNLHFFYDAQSRPAMVNFNGTLYHYVHNLQGDIVALVDDAGTKVVEYKYDAWGKPISTTGTLASTLGARNPFRYRGYVYDDETGLYYLRSRYYNPVWGRFVNADTSQFAGNEVLESNSFCYCRNTVVNVLDEDGREYEWADLPYIGFIHLNVQMRICSANIGIFPEIGVWAIRNGHKKYVGRIDLVRPASGMCWEIKPLTQNSSVGTDQLQKYLAASSPVPGKALTAGSGLPSGEFTCSSGNAVFAVSYLQTAPGVVQYKLAKLDFQRIQQFSPSPVYDVQPASPGVTALFVLTMLSWAIGIPVPIPVI